MAWITPIIDRSAQDLINKVDKAYLQYTDLNRIEGNVEYVRTTLIANAYEVPALTIKTTWIEEDMIYLPDLERIRSNIDTIKTYWNYASTSIPASLTVSYTKFNDVENILLQSKTAIESMIASYKFCGTYNSGGSAL